MILHLDEYAECCTECCFYRLSEKAGFKLSFHKKDADYSWLHQRIAHHNGIAPRVGSKVRKVDRYFGYCVELVEIINASVEAKKLEELQEKFYKVFGFYHADDHYDNIGIKEGKYLFIDFGRMMNKKTTFDYYNNKRFHFLRKEDVLI